MLLCRPRNSLRGADKALKAVMFKPKPCLVCLEKDKIIAHECARLQEQIYKPCEVCKEKDLRIAYLEQSLKQLNDRHDKHVSFLHNQLQPGPQLPLIDYEASRVMDGGTEEPLPVLSDEEKAKIVAIEDERNKLLSGNYE